MELTARGLSVKTGEAARPARPQCRFPSWENGADRGRIVRACAKCGLACESSKALCGDSHVLVRFSGSGSRRVFSLQRGDYVRLLRGGPPPATPSAEMTGQRGLATVCD